MANHPLSKLTPEAIFKIHPRMRWAAYSTRSGDVVFSQMRPGVKTATSDEADRAIMRGASMMMSSGALDQFIPKAAGPLESIVINLQKISLIWIVHKDGYLAITTGRIAANSVLRRLNQTTKQLRGT